MLTKKKTLLIHVLNREYGIHEETTMS